MTRTREKLHSPDSLPYLQLLGIGHGSFAMLRPFPLEPKLLQAFNLRYAVLVIPLRDALQHGGGVQSAVEAKAARKASPSEHVCKRDISALLYVGNGLSG